MQDYSGRFNPKISYHNFLSDMLFFSLLVFPGKGMLGERMAPGFQHGVYRCRLILTLPQSNAVVSLVQIAPNKRAFFFFSPSSNILGTFFLSLPLFLLQTKEVCIILVPPGLSLELLYIYCNL